MSTCKLILPVRPTFLRQVKQRFFLGLDLSASRVAGCVDTSDPEDKDENTTVGVKNILLTLS